MILGEPTTNQATSQTGTRQPDAGPYAWYVVALLIVAYTFSFIDRQILTLMVGPIRETLKISDTGLSLLHGFAFALFYSVMGIPAILLWLARAPYRDAVTAVDF